MSFTFNNRSQPQNRDKKTKLLHKPNLLIYSRKERISKITAANVSVTLQVPRTPWKVRGPLKHIKKYSTHFCHITLVAVHSSSKKKQKIALVTSHLSTYSCRTRKDSHRTVLVLSAPIITSHSFATTTVCGASATVLDKYLLHTFRVQLTNINTKFTLSFWSSLKTFEKFQNISVSSKAPTFCRKLLERGMCSIY